MDCCEGHQKIASLIGEYNSVEYIHEHDAAVALHLLIEHIIEVEAGISENQGCQMENYPMGELAKLPPS